MAQISRLSELQDRKQALVAESEIYRQKLRLEVQNLRIYASGARRRFAWMRLAPPLLMLAGSFAGSSLLTRRLRMGQRGRWSWLGMTLMVWRLLRNYGPGLQKLFSDWLQSGRSRKAMKAEK